MNKKFNKHFIYYPVATSKGFNINIYLKRLLKSQYFSPDVIENNQLIKLKKIIQYSKKHVPYYSTYLNNIEETNIKKIIDLNYIPFLTKSTLKKYPSSIRSNNKYFMLTKKTTAGSTGEPFTLWKSTSAMAQELAASWRGYSWAGVDIGDRQGRFWGVPLKKIDFLKSKIIDLVANRVRCSAFSFDVKMFNDYTKKLTDFKPDYFYGYVSMLVQYANYFLEANIVSPFELKCIITTSEILTVSDRKILENVFKTKIFNEYGSAEVGTIAHECSYGSLHVSAENMIVEILDNDRICRPGELGEIVITELNNFAMPLIRYKTGDLGSLSLKKCKCGINLPMIEKLEGRTWDMIIRKDGKKFHPAFFLYIFEDAKDKNLGISHYKIYQKDYQKFRILIVPDSNYNQKTEQFITEEIRKGFDQNSLIDFELVGSIKREISGKLRQVVGMNEIS